MKQNCKQINADSGFTLVELLMAMTLFVVIMIIATQGFNTIISSSSKLIKSEETNIEGVIGLEMLRHDIEQIGFGLPWGWSKRSADGELVDATIKYYESVDSTGLLLNDNSGSSSGSLATKAIPRAFVGLAGKGAFSSDYIGLKGTTVGRDQDSQRWTYVPYHNVNTGTEYVSQPTAVAFSNPPQAGDKVIAINANFNNSDVDHRLLMDPSNEQFFTISFSIDSIGDDYLPVSDQDTVMLYGVGGDRMPFNRADYFIGNTETPSFCAENTGVLYKASVNHSDGKYYKMPLLDCVADMKVVVGWDTSENASAGANVYSSLPKASGATPDYFVLDDFGVISSDLKDSVTKYFTSAQDIRERLKTVKIYLLAQDGKRSSSYQGPATLVVGADPSEVGGLPTTSNTYTFSAEQRKFHWKLYRIAVKPKNLIGNQK